MCVHSASRRTSRTASATTTSSTWPLARCRNMGHRVHREKWLCLFIMGSGCKGRGNCQWVAHQLEALGACRVSRRTLTD
eukprot:1830693-Heterocapsa_arctica.AAC.1